MQFKNNKPGIDWFRNFMKRNHQLSERYSENIKRSRAAVDAGVINAYFDNLEISLAGISSSNIINYDETNFTDDPGNEKVVVKRGVKHTERILDFSKTSNSVMMAVTGNGVRLPPYIVYFVLLTLQNRIMFTLTFPTNKIKVTKYKRKYGRPPNICQR